MEPPRNYCEPLECFNDHHVSAIVVGAYALAYHGAPRMTGDLDVLVERSAETTGRHKDLADFESLGDE